MKGHLKYYLVFAPIIFGSCIFSGGDLEENNFVDGFYISSLAGSNSLVYKDRDASTEKILLPGQVDSIGWSNILIGAFSGGQYFVIHRQSQSINSYRDYEEYKAACKKIDRINEIRLRKIIGAQIQ